MHGETGKRHGSLIGAVISLAMGFAFYFILKLIEGEGSFFDYGNIINGITGSFPKQVIWYFMNFTEA